MFIAHTISGFQQFFNMGWPDAYVGIYRRVKAGTIGSTAAQENVAAGGVLTHIAQGQFVKLQR